MENSTEKNKLLPCCFCGGEAKLVESLSWVIKCKTCNLELSLGNYKNKAIKAWNTRYQPTCESCDRWTNTGGNVGKCFLYDVLHDEYHHKNEYCNRWESKDEQLD